jgi:hypothetical protein
VSDPQGRSIGPPIATVTNPSNPLYEAVTALAIAPDGRTIAVATGAAIWGPVGGALSLWNLESRTLKARLGGHGERINALAFSPDGRILASAGGQFKGSPGRRDYGVRVWDVETGNALSPPWLGHQEQVAALAFAADGRTLSTLDRDGVLIKWRGSWRQWLEVAEERSLPLRARDAAEDLRSVADQLVAKNELDSALAVYARALQQTPSDDRVHWARSQVLRRLGRLKEALQDQSAALQLAPFNGVYLFERAKVRRLLGDNRGALADFSSALDLAPFIVRTAPVIAPNSFNDQMSEIAQKLAKVPAADVHKHRAEVRIDLRDLPGARQDIDAAIALGLENADIYRLRARVRRESGDVSGALGDEQKAVSFP